MGTTGTSVARRGSTSIGKAARSQWDAAQIETIRATVARDATEPELAMFLEICARYELDPFAKQVFFAKMPGRNGGQARVAIIVGRDGFQVIASRNKSYRGVLSGVVREKDEFEVCFAKDGVDLGGGQRLRHLQRGTHRTRGPVVGAWAVAYRDGRQPRWFYAPIEEYMPSDPPPTSPWKKGQKSVMIEKVAIATALRTQFEISGLYDEAEFDAIEGSHMSGGAPPVVEAGIDWPEDEALAARLSLLFEEAERVVPGSWLPAKVRMTLSGKTEGEKGDLAAELERFILKHGGALPEPVDVVEATAVEEPVDGEDADPPDE